MKLLFSPVETVIRVAAGDKKQKSPGRQTRALDLPPPLWAVVRQRRSRARLLGFCGTVEGQKKKNPGRVNAGTASPHPRDIWSTLFPAPDLPATETHSPGRSAKSIGP
jgi:hypothetical protein